MKKLLPIVISTALFAAAPAGAWAAQNKWLCTQNSDPLKNSYYCTYDWGYLGTDPYNVDRFSAIFPDGTKHSCTSFAAYMLYYSNSYQPAIANFDSAQYWDTDAVAKAHATVGSVPHIGDIAQWDAAQVSPKGHVAVVIDVVRTSSGALYSVTVADDNAGLGYTSQRVLYPSATSGVISWPHTFITFPGFSGTLGLVGGGGGKPYQVTSIPVTNGGN